MMCVSAGPSDSFMKQFSVNTSLPEGKLRFVISGSSAAEGDLRRCQDEVNMKVEKVNCWCSMDHSKDVDKNL